MTPNKEDYLKVIFKSDEENGLISNKEIARQMNIAPASVSEMLVKLSKEGLIYYEPYKGSRLTEEGKKWCLKVIRAHRIWEVFLTECLNYTKEKAHKEAHNLEHVSSDEMIERLFRFLNSPKCCPDGNRIPENE